MAGGSSADSPPIRVLVVDDSALMRRVLSQMFQARPEFVVQTAHDGEDAIARVGEFEPDVITLDVNMPRMDGITALSQIMVERPTPVVMVSSLTQRDALPTLEALALGAVDFVPKPSGTVSRDLQKVEAELVEKVRCAAQARPARTFGRSQGGRSSAAKPDSGAQRLRSQQAHAPCGGGRAKPTATPGLGPDTPEGAVLIGVSTGGPRTLEHILPQLPAHFPYPVLLIIHMPSTFTGAFARRMDQLCEVPVVEVTRQTPLAAGTVYVGRGDADFILATRAGKPVAMLAPADTAVPWHPSVDRLVQSALRCMSPDSLLGVQLTGMGDDGAKTMAQLHAAGGYTIAESEESAVVFGMPRVLIEMGGASVVLPAQEISDEIVRWAGNMRMARCR